MIISQFDNSDYDALWDEVTGDIILKPNGDIPRDPVTFPTILNYRTGLLCSLFFLPFFPFSISSFRAFGILFKQMYILNKLD